MAKALDVQRKWYIVDAEGKTLGRLATEIASVLKGKHKPIYTPHVDTGDFVVVINAEKVVVTGNKANQKLYRKHSGFQGGLKEIPYAVMMKKHPERIISIAVRGMIPHNKLGSQMIKKLKVYAGTEHPHTAQQPEVLEIG
jgi:large subunit ribosomal protein L13